MPDVDTGPLLKPNDEIRFLDSHRPDLADGDYEITLKQSVPSLGIEAQRSLQFSVAGPRFALQPSEIASQFPPKGAKGDFESVLPHVLLSRSTLPWERSALGGESNDRPGDPPSWLALLVFTEEEIAGREHIVKASDLLTNKQNPPARGARFLPLKQAAGDDPQLPVHVLELPLELAREVLPKAADLAFLTSARQVIKADGEGTATGQGMVIANRLPHPGKRNFVHLVSIEQQYQLRSGADPKQPWAATHAHWSDLTQPGAGIQLVSLASWDFFCEPDHGDLQSILNSLRVAPLALSTEGLGASQKAVYEGHVPLEHRLAAGNRTASWYRGPLQTTYRGVNLPLPTRQSRDLIRIDEFTGMAEVSYAAAWELGRLLALKSPVIGIGLNQWKRQVAHAGHRAVHADLLDELDQQIPSSPVLPPQIAAWFENALGRLASLPFDYLIPDPELLPPETMAWFSLDRAWMAALYDGAFSIGRGSNRQLDADRQLAHALPKVGTRSGFIVRSRAVSGWTDLLVDGYRTQAGQSPLLEPIRHERIGRDTLLVLYAGPIDAVSIHLHPQALHFGFDGSAESGFQKDGHPVKLSQPGRVVDLAELAASLGVTGAHDFTLEMIEPTASISHRFTVPHD